MNAHRLIEDARAAGMTFEVVGDELIVEVERDPPPDLLAELRLRKAEVIAALIPAEVAADLDVEQLGEPAQLADGRRLYRFHADEIPSAARPNTRAVMDDARWRGIVLVADGQDLIVVERWLGTLATETLLELKQKAGAVIAALRGESRERTAYLDSGAPSQAGGRRGR